MEEKSRAQELSVREISLIRELAQIRKEHKRELEYEKFDGYELPPRTQFSPFCRAHSTDALSSSGHIINASRFLLGCKIGRTYLIPSKSRMHAILNFITPYFMLTAGLFSMENWVRGGSS